MIDRFCYKVYLPSKKAFFNFYELTNKEYLAILKFNRNADKPNLSKYLENLIIEKSVDQLDDLHRIDKFCIILTMIIVSIKPVFKLVGTCEESDSTYDIHINANDILDKISNIVYTDMRSSIGDDLVIYYGYSTDLYIDTDDYNIFDIITDITYKDITYHMHDYPIIDRLKVIDHLPAQSFSHMRTAIETLNDRYNDTVILSHQSPHMDDPEVHTYPLSMINNIFFDVIYLLLGDDLRGFYELSHAMSSNFHFSQEHFLSITPAEVQTFYNFMRRDVEKQRDDIKKSQTSNLDPAQAIASNTG